MVPVFRIQDGRLESLPNPSRRGAPGRDLRYMEEASNDSKPSNLQTSWLPKPATSHFPTFTRRRATK
jgi:hypothetical protein